MLTEEFNLRNQALYWANETHPNRFNVAEKPTVEDIISRAKKFERFLAGATDGIND